MTAQMIGEAKGITGRGFQQPCCWTGVLPVGIWLGLFWLIQYPHGDLCHRPPNGHSFSGTGTKNRRNHVLPFTRSRCPRMATRRTTAASERIAAMWMMGHPAYRPRAISTPTPLYTLRRTRSNRESQDRRCELPRHPASRFHNTVSDHASRKDRRSARSKCPKSL